MNDLPTQIEPIRNEISQLTLDLNKRRDDLALLERLQQAKPEITRITQRLDKLTATLSKAMDAKAKADKAERAARYRNMTVTYAPGENLLRTGFTISYQQRAFDGRESGWQDRAVSGFRSLDPDVMEYLLSERSDEIPAPIRELASDPRDAMNAYFVSLRRGYIRG